MGAHSKHVLDNLTAKRTGEDTVEVAWQSRKNPPEVAIYQGNFPDVIDRQRPVARVLSGNRATISGLPRNKRIYFAVAVKDAPGEVVTERRVTLEGTFNFRDLGGYATVDGRRVKWGEVYRSDNLSRLTDEAVQMFVDMGVRQVCDLRSEGEAASRPNRLPDSAGISVCHMPVVQGSIDGMAVFEKIKQGDTSWFTDDFMVDGYIRCIDRFAETWGALINLLADRQSRAMVFHCSAGKDRTGIAAALVLSLLGVPEETIIADHQLSNIHIAPALGDIYRRIRSFGVDPERIADYFAAPRECIVAMLDHLGRVYGSADRYLSEKGGVSPKTIEKLKNALLA